MVHRRHKAKKASTPGGCGHQGELVNGGVSVAVGFGVESGSSRYTSGSRGPISVSATVLRCLAAYDAVILKMNKNFVKLGEVVFCTNVHM